MPDWSGSVDVVCGLSVVVSVVVVSVVVVSVVVVGSSVVSSVVVVSTGLHCDAICSSSCPSRSIRLSLSEPSTSEGAPSTASRRVASFCWASSQAPSATSPPILLRAPVQSAWFWAVKGSPVKSWESSLPPHPAAGSAATERQRMRAMRRLPSAIRGECSCALIGPRTVASRGARAVPRARWPRPRARSRTRRGGRSHARTPCRARARRRVNHRHAAARRCLG